MDETPLLSHYNSNISLLDSSLNLLIQSYASFDDASDESELKLEKRNYAIALPVIENQF